MASSFLDTFFQQVDEKGRTSVPADFRTVLADGDPRSDEARTPQVYLVREKSCVHAYTIEMMEKIQTAIDRMPHNSRRRTEASRTFHASASVADIDKDGRIILPMRLREHLGLEGGGKAKSELVMVGMGDHFEIMSAPVHERLKAWQAAQQDGDDPDDFGYSPLGKVEGI